MKLKFWILFFGLICNYGYSQTSNPYSIVDSKMSKIPDSSSNSIKSISEFITSNFTTENDKIRAVFYFTASNISYDVEKLKKVNQNQNINETATERIQYSLVYKKGVCANYADVFSAIANELNIKTYLITGYTKQFGEIVNLSHAWCASKIDNKWYIFDPTWGSGYVNNMIYTRKIDDSYFKTNPNISITNHMPFDYLWQFLNYPVTNDEFYNNKFKVNKTKIYFDFESEILKHENSSAEQKNLKSAVRIEKNGLKNKMIIDYLLEKKAIITFDDLNKISNYYNTAIQEFNNYVTFRNKQFKPNIPDQKLKNLIQIPRDKFIDCQERLAKIVNVDAQNIQNLKGLKQSLIQILPQVEDQLAFVNEYLSKSNFKRKEMFTKITLFGLKLN